MNRRQFLKGIGLGVSALSLAGCGGAFATADSPKRTNIVFILTDDMGWNDIGYHNTEIRSPNIDELAAAGVELDQHYVQPQCTPTRVALMTGRYPSRFADHCTQASNDHAYPFDTPTIASILKSSGYTTGCFGKWHMGSRPEWGPNHHGFDYSYGSLAGAVGMYDHRYRLKTPYTQTWHRNHKLIGEQKGHATDLVTAEAVKWIEKNKDKPFFCYVPYHSVHTPLVEEEKWFEMNRHIKDPDRRLMAAAVSHLDDCVGRIVETLEQNALRDKTLIIFVSDNGGIHGNYSGGNYPAPDPALKKGFSSNLPLKGGKTTVYEGGIRVPALINWKGTITPSKNATVSHIVDWAPTLTYLAGAKLEEDPAWDGMDIWPFITGKERPAGNRQLYWVWGKGRRRVALRKGDWKLCRNNATKWELYNLADDPYETTDLANDMPDKVGQLKSLIRKEKQRDNL